MDEEKKEKAEIKKEEPAPADPEKRVLPATTPLIDVANNVAERIEKANQKTAELLDRQEQIEARKALGGHSEAGQGTEGAKEFFKGTVIEKALEKHG